MAGGSTSDTNDKKCRFCSKFAGSGDIKCKTEGCEIVVHNKCLDAICKVVYVDKNNFLCRRCIESSENTSGSCSRTQCIVLQKEVECLTREKILLEKYVSELEFSNKILKTSRDFQREVPRSVRLQADQCESEKSTYASAVKRSRDSHVLLVKTIDKNVNNIVIENEIKSKVNPSSAQALVLGTKRIKDGILISCGDNNSLEKLKSLIGNETKGVYNVTVPKKLRPRIMVYGVDSYAVGEPDFLEKVIHINNLNCSIEDIKFITKIKFKDKFNVVLEVAPLLFNDIIKRKFLYLGWSKCFVKEHFSFIRCFKCWKFGHYRRECKSECDLCPKCSGPHEIKNCDSNDICCVNCKFLNSRFNTAHDIGHSANSSICNYFLSHIGKLKSRIDYAE